MRILRLRPLGLVDEHEPPPGRAGRLPHGVRDARSGREARREPLREPLGAPRLDVAREPEREVPLHEVRPVRGAHVLVREPGERLARARRAPRVGVALEDRLPERHLGEALVVVACLDELGDRLAAEAVELGLGEGGLGDEGREQIDERAEVSLDDLPVDGRGRHGHLGRELGAEPVELVLDVVRRVRARPAAEHAERELRCPLLARGVGGRAAPERDGDRDERHLVRLRDLDRRAARELEPRDGVAARRASLRAGTLAPGHRRGRGAHCAASTWRAASSGSTRITVLPRSTMYRRAAFRRSLAVRRRYTSRRWNAALGSPSTVS